MRDLNLDAFDVIGAGRDCLELGSLKTQADQSGQRVAQFGVDDFGVTRKRHQADVVGAVVDARNAA